MMDCRDSNLSFPYGTARIQLLSLVWLDFDVPSYIFIFLYPDWDL